MSHVKLSEKAASLLASIASEVQVKIGFVGRASSSESAFSWLPDWTRFWSVLARKGLIQKLEEDGQRFFALTSAGIEAVLSMDPNFRIEPANEPNEPNEPANEPNEPANEPNEPANEPNEPLDLSVFKGGKVTVKVVPLDRLQVDPDQIRDLNQEQALKDFSESIQSWIPILKRIQESSRSFVSFPGQVTDLIVDAQNPAHVVDGNSFRLALLAACKQVGTDPRKVGVSVQAVRFSSRREKMDYQQKRNNARRIDQRVDLIRLIRFYRTEYPGIQDKDLMTHLAPTLDGIGKARFSQLLTECQLMELGVVPEELSGQVPKVTWTVLRKLLPKLGNVAKALPKGTTVIPVPGLAWKVDSTTRKAVPVASVLDKLDKDSTVALGKWVDRVSNGAINLAPKDDKGNVQPLSSKNFDRLVKTVSQSASIDALGQQSGNEETGKGPKVPVKDWKDVARTSTSEAEAIQYLIKQLESPDAPNLLFLLAGIKTATLPASVARKIESACQEVLDDQGIAGVVKFQ